MQKIEGIVLGEELRAAEKELLEEQRRKVRSLASGVVQEIIKHTKDKQEKEKEIKKIEEKINSAKAKYEKIKEGDWSVLNENMLKNQPTCEK